MFRNNRGQVRSGWLIMLTMFLFLICSIVFAFPGTVWFNVINEEAIYMSNSEYMRALSKLPWVELAMNGGAVVGGIIATILAWKFINKQNVKDLGISINSVNMKDFVVGIGLGVLSMTLIFTILVMSGSVELEQSLLEPVFSVQSVSFLILYILVGFSEEMLGRGYIMKTMLDRGNSKLVALITSSIIFSLLHSMNPNVSILGLMNIVFVGILFAYMYLATNSLWMPIGYHITWNYFQGNVFGFPVSGIQSQSIYEVSLIEGRDLLTGGTFGPEAGLLATVVIMLGIVFTKIYSHRREEQSFDM
ncbi:CPBP family intramembrane glutamic endopeptidase [Bacillus solimangrovi]|uniref:CAAX protease n=1 Tax=Bacillus solimangrovi TaxID=1305675 RepID=A0A1E5LIB8_9BACI|nr:CPBP family intramembrane glutamic endopeptidase [Bacillus solimangrovi]OEH93815.1 CAAX protease [Bacillus solimangrovi]